MLSKVTEKVKALAFSEGFHLVGVSSVEPQSEHLAFYETWLQKGLGGEMEYLKRNLEKKKNPRSLYPEAKTILCCALSYKTSFENPS